MSRWIALLALRGGSRAAAGRGRSEGRACQRMVPSGDIPHLECAVRRALPVQTNSSACSSRLCRGGVRTCARLSRSLARRGSPFSSYRSRIPRAFTDVTRWHRCRCLPAWPGSAVTPPGSRASLDADIARGYRSFPMTAGRRTATRSSPRRWPGSGPGSPAYPGEPGSQQLRRTVDRDTLERCLGTKVYRDIGKPARPAPPSSSSTIMPERRGPVQ